ncbi:hypothetical protein PHLGIDRAFT_21508 [Phlebiopsis gigantea 11061_1 CR5-6]|uniref:Uncharacterized protein n=1 Tax=Phlebiopsis gigantea (strain 11061_1 CR5-6) TaxID=745531 RepID=A0A0C3SD57_PHLG1|nr:hypothetical protein PHLGIDRAFT_21508 [Phlebiopsis gigantea 11061_1 CR5-6]
MDAVVYRLRAKLQNHPDNHVLQQALSACTALGDDLGGMGMRNVGRALDSLREEGLWDADDQGVWEDLQKTVTQEQSTSGSSTNPPAGSALHERVETLVHRAFWDEALESLSNPSPPVQLARLKRLYEDLHIALTPLLPSGHPILFALSAPLSPTSSPLRSTTMHLREVLGTLKQRCAPARDPQIDALFSVLDASRDDTLPNAIVDVIRSLMKIADEMKDDLSQFVLGSMDERQLRDVITKQAATSERELVLQLWEEKAVKASWKQWLDEVHSPTHHSAHSQFLQRLVRAVATNQSVSCNLPAVSVIVSPSGALQFHPSPSDETPLPPNSLPPPLLFITPTLFYIQNYLQALVITAALRSLVRIPTTPAKRKADDEDNQDMSEDGFLSRIWTLLKGDIDGEDTGLKLINLADEVVRISRMYGGTLDDAQPDTKESQLREAVDRTLKPTDPVFLLLQKRLVDAITAHLLAHTPPPVPDNAPREMHTGRGAKKAKLVLSAEDAAYQHLRLEFAQESLSVKGFEHLVLSGAVSDLVLMLRKCMAWTEFVWQDLFEAV